MLHSRSIANIIALENTVNKLNYVKMIASGTKQLWKMFENTVLAWVIMIICQGVKCFEALMKSTCFHMISFLKVFESSLSYLINSGVCIVVFCSWAMICIIIESA